MHFLCVNFTNILKHKTSKNSRKNYMKQLILLIGDYDGDFVIDASKDENKLG